MTGEASRGGEKQSFLSTRIRMLSSRRKKGDSLVPVIGSRGKVSGAMSGWGGELLSASRNRGQEIGGKKRIGRSLPQATVEKHRGG